MQNFINVYRDEKGEIHYSTEEFRIGQDKLNQTEALAEAESLAEIASDWEYVGTMTICPKTTALFKQCLRDAEEGRRQEEEERRFVSGLLGIARFSLEARP